MFFLVFFFAFVSFHFLFFKVLYIRARSKVTRTTVGRDTDRPTNVFELVKLILQPVAKKDSQVLSQDVPLSVQDVEEPNNTTTHCGKHP